MPKVSQHPTITLIYGFAEGLRHAQPYLIPALKRAGFEITTDTDTADIILVHSGGCFQVPQNHKRQLVVLVGPPFWPGKPVVVGMAQKIALDIAASLSRHDLSYWLAKTTLNFWYVLTQPRRTLSIAFNARLNNFYKTQKRDNVVIIRHDQDAFCMPEIAPLLRAKASFKFVSVPGQHDDIWRYPEPVIKIISELLAADQPA